MNRIYRSVWNEITRTFVAAAETVRGRGKPSSGCSDGAPASRRPALTRRRPLPLALEQRFMFDGAAVATADAAAAAAAAAQAAIAHAPAAVEVRAAEPAKDGGKNEVVFVDTSVKDYKTLEAGIRDGVAIVEIDGAKDGLAQIAKWAQTHSGYDSISILGHGSQATLNLGTTALTSASLGSATVQSELAEIGEALTVDGDLMLYGCDIASGSSGEAFIAALADATGADVAASSDATGAAAKGGDWVLEKTAGTLESQAFNVTDYSGLLTETTFDLDSGQLTGNSDTARRDYYNTANEYQLTFTASGYSSQGHYDLTSDYGTQTNAYTVYNADSRGVISTTVSISGKLFDLTSFDIGDGFTGGGATVTITTSKGGSTQLTLDKDFSEKWFSPSFSGDSFHGVSWFTVSYDNSKISASQAQFFLDNIVLSDIVTPPTVSASLPDTVWDTAAADTTFSNVSGTLTATAAGGATINAYGIAGGTSGTYTIGVATYQVKLAGAYGTLYVNSSTGAYVYDPDEAKVNALGLFYSGGGATRVDSFIVAATDSAGATGNTQLSINLNGANDTPIFSSATTATVAENASGAVYTAEAFDCDREHTLTTAGYATQTLSYSLSGTDAALFSIDGSTGKVSFVNAPNYESPGDSDHDNVYDVTVEVTVTDRDTKTGEVTTDSASQAVQITVTDANDAPVFSSAATGSVAENGAAGEVVYTAAATDPEGAALTYSVSGADAAAFTIDGASGELKLNAAADYETKSSYSIRIQASDGSQVGTRDVTIAVSEVNDKPVITAPATQNVDQGKSTPITGISVSDPDAGNDTITVTLYASAGMLTATDASGVHVDSSGSDSIMLSGSRTSLNEFIAAGKIGYTSAGGATGDVTITINADDYRSGGTADRQTLTLKIIAPNAAPVLSAVSPALTAITEKETGNAGQSVASFVGNSIADTNSGALQGIAITGLTTGNGVWQYRTDAGASWTDVGTVTDASALLLRATDTIRFVPNGVAGTTASITYRAWDQTSGTAGGKADTTGNGGETAFSTATDTASITASDVNDAPTAIQISNAAISVFDGSDAVVGSLSATDIDSTSFTYSVVGVSLGGASRSADLFNISGSNLRAASPTTLAAGTYTVVVRADDGAGGTYDQTLGIVVSDTLTVTTADDQASGGGTYAQERTDDGGLSLREAVALATTRGGATIRFADGLSTVNTVTLDSTLTIDSDITIDTDALTSLTIEGNFNIASGKALTLSNGAGDNLTLKHSITGEGMLAKTGSGTLTLSADSDYGGTRVERGTLTVASNGALGIGGLSLADGTTLAVAGTHTLSNEITLVDGLATIDTGDGATLTLQGAGIKGSGGFIKAGTGTLDIRGINLSSGAARVDAGTLAIGGTNGLAGGGSLSLADGTTLVVSGAMEIRNAIALTGSATIDSALALTLKGAISGTGSLIKTGSGSLTLSGNNSYTGTTTVSAGALSIAADTNLGGGGISLTAGTWLYVTTATTIDNVITLTGTGDAIISNSAALTLSGAIGGSGSLLKHGSATLTLTGANSYTGATTVHQGTLAIAGDGKLGGGMLTLRNGATLAVSATMTAINGVSIDADSTIEVASGATATLSGTISGSGFTLTKAGAGTLTLTGTSSNDNVGRLAVSAGTLATGDECMRISLGVDVGNGATFALGSGAMLGAFSGGGSVALGAHTLNVGSDNSSTTFSGTISGSGGFIKAGNGTLTLTGSNTYTGTTQVSSGGTLVLAGGSAIADSSHVAVNGTLILNASETIGALFGSGSVSLVGSTLTVGGGIGSKTFDGVISGSGSLVKVGSYVQTFTKANTYSGTTKVLGGTLALRNNGTIGSGALSLAAETTLAVTGTQTTPPTLANDVTLAGNATILSDANVALTLAGAVGGDGGLVKTGAGTLVLSGANNYKGTTTVSGGTLAIASAANLGAGAISLANATTLAASGYAVLDQAVTLAGSATIDCASALVLSGIVSGDGSLVKTGSGSLTLSGNNSYQGTTTISTGYLELANDASLGIGSVSLAGGAALSIGQAMTIDNAIELSGTGRVTISNTFALTLSGIISGSGGLLVNGYEAVALTGANTYSGGTTIDDATLAIAGDASLGSGKLTLQNNATLAVSGATTIANAIELYDNTFIDVGGETTLSGAISGGSGTLTKTGAGTLILAGVNERISHTVVAGGTLWVNTALTGAVNAQSGTTVGGSGSISETLNIAAGATLAPGAAGVNSGVGKLTVGGALTLDGALAIEVSGDTSYDQIVAQWDVVLGEHSAIAVTRVGGYTRSNATQPFTFIDGTTSAISGAFKDIAQGGVLVSGGDVYTVNCAGGSDTHDLVLAGKPVPSVAALTSATADGVYKAGSEIDIVVSFDQVVSVSGGVPTLLLETGVTDRAARYVSGSGSKTLHFQYTVEAGDNSADLDCASGATLQLNGATLRDAYGQDAALTLPAGSLAASKAIVIDACAPAAPAAPTLDVTSDSGSSNSDGITGNTTPTINGTAEAGSTVTLYDGATAVGSATADASGNWTIVCSPLAEGAHTLAARATDAAGNVSAASSALTLTIDTQVGAPSALALAGKPGNATNSTTPTIAGSAEAYATVTLYEGATVLGSATADAASHWVITSATTLAEGTHTLTASAIDRAGNASAASSTLTINVDTCAPGAPSAPVLAAASDSGSSNSDGITRVTTPTLSGSAEAGSTVTLYDGANVLGSATTDGSGHWTITTSTLSGGMHTLTAWATDAAGNASSASAALAITVDASAPAAPAAPTLAAASDSGSSSGDGITSNTTPTISGAAEAGSRVTLYDGTTEVGSATADGSGAWTISNLALTAGTHTLTARATDAAGNVSAASSTLTVTIDTQAGAPAALALAGKAGNATNSPLPTIAGSAEAYATVTLYEGGAVLGSATADGAGRWVITSGTTLAEGAHTLTATAIDRAGNASAASSALTINVDTSAPAAPSAPVLAAASDSGSSPSDQLTRIATPAVSGTAEAGSTVTLYDSDHATVLGSATADGSGNWTITCSSLAAGAHALSATATDAAGNASAASSALTIAIDASAPATPAAPILAAASDSGASASDGITRNTSPTISGTAEARSTVTLYDSDGVTVLGSATADGSGNWSITSAPLAEGAHALTARATDAAGNASAASSALAISIDTQTSAPTALAFAAGSDSGISASDGITRNTTPTINGTAEARSTVTLYDSDHATALGSATADASGHWTITSAPLADGAHVLSATATDAAGNASAASSTLAITIDTGAPVRPAAPVLAAASDSGISASDQLTRVTTPVVTGSAEAGSRVTLYDGDGVTVLGSATADGSGNWTITCSSLAAGAHALSATATDAAGNASAASSALAIRVDFTAPATPLLAAAGSKYAPTISGSAEAGSSVTLYDGSTVVGSATADGAGAWSISGATLAVGTYALTAKATDAAGNVSAASAALAVTVEAPVPPPQVLVPPTIVVPQAATSTAPATTVSEVAAAGPSFIAPTSELALTATLTSSGASAATPLAALVAPATTAFAAPTNEGSSSSSSGQTPTTDATRASPATAVLTQGGGFQVVVASSGGASASAAVDGIVVNRGVADQSLASGATVEFAIPADAFAAGSASAAVTLSVRQADGRPLPAWLHFDAASGRFDGEPPPGYTGEVAIRVVARDAQGHEAVTTFKVRVSRTVNADGQRAQPERGERSGRASLSEQLRAAARAHPALERLARFTGWRDAA
jgi:autotransporter-associated beta strand protein/VCBS repeat-containing protein